MRLFLLFSIPFAILAGCRRPEPAVKSVPVVKTAVAEAVGFVDRDFAGMATASDATNLAFKVSGQVTAIKVAEGRSVKRGELLAEIDPRDYQLQMAADKAAYETAKSQFDRAERLLARQAVSRQEYEMTSTAYAAARRSYENSRDLLGETRITAPFAGIIEKQYVDTYQRVQAGEPVLRLVNPVSRNVKFTMPESGLPLLERSGLTFTVEYDNYKGVWFAARLKEYVQTSSDGTGVPVSLTMDDRRLDSGKYTVTPGMACMVNLRIESDGDPDMTAVPLTALFNPDGGPRTYVWVVGAARRVERREVETGDLYGRDMITLPHGLRPGERIVTAGVYKLRDGDEVRISNL